MFLKLIANSLIKGSNSVLLTRIVVESSRGQSVNSVGKYV